MPVTVPTLFEEPYARLTASFPGLRVVLLDPAADRLPAGCAGWTPADHLARDPDTVDRLIAFDSDHGRRAYGTRLRPDVAASFCLYRYAWSYTALLSLPWFLHRRVPRLPVHDVALHRASGRWALRAETFACLPSDPEAQRPEARVVPNEDALRAELRGAVAEHLGPLLEAFRPWTRRGPRMLWGMVTDGLVESLWFFAARLGEEQRAVSELRELLPGGTPPLVADAGFHVPTPEAEGGPRRVTRTRVSCCLYYTVDRETLCSGCPRACQSG